jgi:hypothetical protein
MVSTVNREWKAAYSNWSKTISEQVPTRIGGPQVPTPLDV